MKEGGPKGPENLSAPRSLLARTLADYRGIEISAPEPLKQNSTKTLAETMDDAAIRTRLQDATDELDKLRVEAQADDAMSKKILQKSLDEFLAPDIDYLRSIGRLPADFDFDPYERFKL